MYGEVFYGNDTRREPDEKTMFNHVVTSTVTPTVTLKYVMFKYAYQLKTFIDVLNTFEHGTFCGRPSNFFFFGEQKYWTLLKKVTLNICAVKCCSIGLKLGD